MAAKRKRLRPRIRRELRTLSNEERDLYFSAIKIMRNTSDALGIKLYGERFRGYDYLLFKHAVTALNGCADQGHLPHNVLTFHRAYLLEFELSILAIAKTLNSSTSLTAVPYWNWFIDLDNESGDFYKSSVWKWWGSPYGDPDNKYCIHDPVFKTKITTVESASKLNPKTEEYIKDALGTHSSVANGYGYWRTPMSPNDCETITRNPGWALNHPISAFSLLDQASDCNVMETFASFSSCTADLGILAPGKINFGPHFAPHVHMGTLYDTHYYGSAVILPVVTALIFLTVFVLQLVFSNVIVMAIPERIQCSLASYRCYEIFQRILLGVGLLLISFSCFLMPTVESYTTGIGGLLKHVKVLKHLHIPFENLKDWRNGLILCPEPGACVPGRTVYSDCYCESRKVNRLITLPLLNDESLHVTGSDFWSGAFSPNENFFFSFHELLDLMHYSWEYNRNLNQNHSDIFGDASDRIDNCEGTSIHDVISGEMCFTLKDVGFDILGGDITASGNVFSKGSSRTPTMRCITHTDILEHTMHPEHKYGHEKPYVYDRLEEQYSWHAIESHQPCPHHSVVCKREDQGDPISFSGEMICISNVKSSRILEVIAEENETKCEVATGRSKPDPPIAVCNCKAERNRFKSLELRKKSLNSRYMKLYSFLSGLFFAAFAIVPFQCTYFSSKDSYTPVAFEE